MKTQSSFWDSLEEKENSGCLEFSEAIDYEGTGAVICSFLNTKGGKLILGANQNKKISGITNAEGEIEKLKSFLMDKIVPTPLFNIDIEKINHKDLIIVSVWKGAGQPYIYDGIIYYREGMVSKKASSQQLSDLLRRKGFEDERWEIKPVPGMDIRDMDLNEINRCINEIVSSGRMKDVPEEPLSFLSKMGLYQNGDFTNGSVILFCKEPVSRLPQASVRLSVFSTGKTGEDIVYDRLFEKNLFQSIAEITDFFDLAYGVSSTFKYNEWQRSDKPRYPKQAIREAILNAFIHRDYSLYSSNFSINIYPRKLVISNHGKLPAGMKISDLSKDHLPQPGNPDIARICFLRKWTDRIGRGTLKMIEQCEQFGFKRPTWSESGGAITVTFPDLIIPFKYEGISEGISEGIYRAFNSVISEGISKGIIKGISTGTKNSMIGILMLLSKGDNLRLTDLSEKLKKPQKTLERQIKILKDVDVVCYLGSKKTGGYKVTSKFKSIVLK